MSVEDVKNHIFPGRALSIECVKEWNQTLDKEFCFKDLNEPLSLEPHKVWWTSTDTAPAEVWQLEYSRDNILYFIIKTFLVGSH